MEGIGGIGKKGEADVTRQGYCALPLTASIAQVVDDERHRGRIRSRGGVRAGREQRQHHEQRDRKPPSGAWRELAANPSSPGE